MLPVTSGNWPCGDALRISQNENKFAHIRQLCSQRKIYYPFGHRHKLIRYGQVLFGAGYNRLTFPLNSGFPETTFTSTAFAWTGGGGVQWKIKPKWAVRLFEFDYEQTRFSNYPNQSAITQGNYRIAIRLVYHIGEK
jgi:hypothetical protein